MEKKVKREATYSRPKSGGSFDNKDRNGRKDRSPRKFDDSQGKRPFKARDGEQRRERKDGDWKGNSDRPKRNFDGDKKPFEKREGGERRPYKKFDGEDRPRRNFDGDKKPFNKREDGERRPYKKFDGEDRPKRNFDGDKKPFNKREDGERRPYKKFDGEDRPRRNFDGDKKPFNKREDGERRPYKKFDGEDRPKRNFDGDKKPFEKREGGERRPYKKFDGEDRPKRNFDGENRRERPFGGSERRERPARSWNEVKLSGEGGDDDTPHQREFNREHAPEDKRPVTARQVAYRALKKIYEQSLFIDVALENQANYTKLNPQDKAFARWLVAGVVRYQKRLNHILEQFWKREPDLQIKIILQMGALQLLLGDNAEHAVVSETVSLCGQKDAQYRGLVNAILRNIIRSDIKNLDGLDAATEYPRWVLADWSQTFGEDVAKDIARQSLEEAEVDISFKMENTDVFLDLAKARPLPGGGARLKGHKGRVNRLPGFKNGAFWVQDAAAQLPVKLLGDIKGKKALDLCAAPGGKSLQMVAQGAYVTAIDLKDRRMQRLKDNFERVRLDVDTIIADVCTWETADKFDIVMLDAPCSATGTLRRHPEILRQRSRDEVAELVELQKTMLNRAKDWVNDNGLMVYCVCSLQAGEGVEQIDRFLAENPDWEKIDLKDKLEELKLAAAYHKGYAYTHPALWQKIGGMDGFFIALLQKKTN